MADDFMRTLDAFRAGKEETLGKTKELRDSLTGLRNQMVDPDDGFTRFGDWLYGNEEIQRRIRTTIKSFDQTINDGEDLLIKIFEDLKDVELTITLMQEWGKFALDMIPIIEVAACMENNYVNYIATAFWAIFLPIFQVCMDKVTEGTKKNMAALGETGLLAALKQSFIFLKTNWKIASAAVVALTLITVSASWFSGYVRNKQLNGLKEKLVEQEEDFTEKLVVPLRKTERDIVNWFKNIETLMKSAGIQEAAIGSLKPSQITGYLATNLKNMQELLTIHQQMEDYKTDLGFEAMKKHLNISTRRMEEGKAKDVRKTLMFWYYYGNNYSYEEIMRNMEVSTTEVKRYRALLMLKNQEDPRLTPQILTLVNKEDGKRLLQTTLIGRDVKSMALTIG